jgi:hypothetical protein
VNSQKPRQLCRGFSLSVKKVPKVPQTNLPPKPTPISPGHLGYSKNSNFDETLFKYESKFYSLVISDGFGSAVCFLWQQRRFL